MAPAPNILLAKYNTRHKIWLQKKGVQGNNEIIMISMIGSGICTPSGLTFVKFIVGIIAKKSFNKGFGEE